MTEGIIQELIQGGAMGLFAAFLVWQHIQNVKRNDTLVGKFQEQLTSMRDEQEKRIETMRERYDAVVEKYRAEKDEIQKTVADQVCGQGEKLQELGQKLDQGLAQMQEVILDKRVREAARSLAEDSQ